MCRSLGLALAVFAAAALGPLAGQSRQAAARAITWEDAAPVRQRLLASDINAGTFPSWIDAVRKTHARRVQEGDLDHLVFYLLQSTKFTTLRALEPALTAKQFVDSGEVPDEVRARAAAFLRAVDSGGSDARLAYFRDLARTTLPDRPSREAALLREYARVMKFVYEKEFVAQRSGSRDAAVAELYRTRGLSTDTAVEAGFLVSEGLAVARALDPALRIRRVLIVGPGLDLAPRTGLLEASAPESYQPWAVIDALLALGLSRPDDLTVVGADINPRVVRHLRAASGRARTLTLVTGIAETENVTLSATFRDYFAQLGAQLGARRDREAAERSEAASPKGARERSEREARGGGAPRALREERSEAASPKGARERSEREARESLQPPRRAEARRGSARGWGPGRVEDVGGPRAPRDADSGHLRDGHLSKTVRVDPAVARVLHAESLDIVAERLPPPAFDLVIATNVLPYFDDVELALALANVTSMLAPGGLFLHNENRPAMEELTASVGLRLEQARHAIIANVRGGPPLADSVFLHRSTGARGSALDGSGDATIPAAGPALRHTRASICRSQAGMAISFAGRFRARFGEPSIWAATVRRLTSVRASRQETGQVRQ